SNAVLGEISPVVEPSAEGRTIVLDASIGVASPVRLRVALALAMANRNSSMNSSAEDVRYFGSFSNACLTAASTWGGTSTPFEESGGTSRVRCFFMIEGIELPLNGTSPHNI